MLLKRFSVIVFNLFLVFEPILLQANSIVVDSVAQAKHQANLTKARNGTQIVNIVNPNSSGLSHNKFSEYSISKQNAILNNATREVNTQLAGIIERNRNLTRSASTILNEVTGTSRTNLEGYTEVAGQRANVIIANPSGVYVKGGGFINVPQATLTTGRPVFDNEILKSFNVNQGIVQFDGEDFNASNINQVDIYAKAIKLNAKIHAKDLNIVAGTNNIKTSPLGIYQGFTKNDKDEKEEFALSSTLLGGIYGNKISFIGTQDGVGVNLPIEVTAQDDLSFDVNGDIVLNKTISNGTLTVKANDVKINKSHSNKVSINSNSLQVNELLGASQNLDIQANSLTNKGIIANGVNTDSTINDKEAQVLKITANEVINEGELFSKNDLDIIGIANSVFTNQGKLSSSSSILIDMKQITNNGLLASLGNINLYGLTFNATDDSIQANNIYFNFINNMTLDNSNYKSKGDIFINKDSSSNVNIQNDNGILQADNNLEINSNTFTADKASLLANNILLNSNSIDFTSGKMKSINELVLNIKNDANFNSSNISANNDININAKDTEANNTTIFSVNKNLFIDVNNINAEEGLFEAKEDITFQSKNNINLNKSNLTALKNITLNAIEDVIISKDDSEITHKDEARVYSAKVQSGNNLQITGKNLFNKNALLNSNETININASNSINNINSVFTAKDIFINKDSSSNVNIQNDNGILQADNNLEINSNTFTADKASLLANNILLNSNSIDFTSGKMKSINELVLNIKNDANFNSSNISANNDININAKDTEANNTTIFSVNKNLFIDVNNINAEEGLFEAKEDITFQSKNNINLNKSNLTALKNITLNAIEDVIISKDDSEITHKDEARVYSAKVQSGNNLQITGKNLFNKNTLLNSNETININASNSINNINSVFTAKDIFINKDSSSNVNIQNDNGILQADNNLEINSNTFTADKASLLANNILLNSNSIDFTSGKMKSINELVLNIKNDANFNSSNISANNDININAKDTEANNTTIFSVNKNLFIDVNNINAEEGLFEAKEDITFQSKNNINLNKSNLTALKNITLNAIEDVIISKDDSEITHKDEARVYSAKVQSGNNLQITGKNLFNKNALLNSNETININASNSINNINSVFTAKDIFINKDSSSNVNIQNDNGILQADNNLEINSNEFNANNLNLTANNVLFNIQNNLQTDNNSSIRANNLLEINSDILNNYGFLIGNLINLNSEDISNYGGIVVNDLLTVNSKNLNNYNTIFSKNNINFYVENNLLNKTDKTILENIDNSLIYAKNYINIQGNKDKTLRINNLTNHSGTIQTLDGDINIFANEFFNRNDDAIIERATNSNVSFKLYGGRGIYFSRQDFLYNQSENGGDTYTNYYTASIKELNEIETRVRQKYIKKYFSSAVINGDFNGKDLKRFYHNWKEYNSSKEFFYYKFRADDNDDGIGSPKNKVFFIDKNKYNPQEVLNEFNNEIYQTLKDTYLSYGLEIIKINNSNISWLTTNEKGKLFEEQNSGFPRTGHYQTPIDNLQLNSNYAIKLGKVQNISSYRNYTIFGSHFSQEESFNYKKKGITTYFTKKPENKKGSQLLSGNNIHIESNTFSNHISTVSAKNNIDFKNSNVKNQSFSSWDSEEIIVTNNRGIKINAFSKDASSIPTETLNATIEAGNDIIGDIKSFENDELSNNNINIKDKQNIQNKVLTNSIENKLNNSSQNNKNLIQKTNSDIRKDTLEKENISTSSKDILNNKNKTSFIQKNQNEIRNNKNTLNINLPTNKFGLYIANTNPSHKYLIETNPFYNTFESYYSSDYFLNKMNYNPNAHIKRLGDAAYETKLVKDAIVNHTGRQYALSNDSINNQYKTMMDNAVNLSGILNLEIGKAPTEEQLANLTEDIVWLEVKNVNGIDVLAPVVYFANEYNKEAGALIVANNNIDLNIEDDFTNTGNIQSNNLRISANRITNKTGAIISNEIAQLLSKNDIKNTNGASIKAGSLALTSKEGSILNDTYTNKQKLNAKRGNTVYTTIGQKSTIESTNGNLVLNAKKDINNNAGTIKSASSLGLYTEEGDINITSKENDNSHYWKKGKNFNKARTLRHIQSNISAKEDVVLSSGKKINLIAAKVNAGNDLYTKSKDDMSVLAVNNIDYKDVQKHSKKSFGRSSTKRKMTYKETVVGSNLKAENIRLNSEKNITLEAANLKADENIIVDAKEDINVTAKQYREGRLKYTKKSGFGGFSKSASMNRSDVLKLKEAKLVTEAKNIILKSQNDIKIIASELSSAGDTQLEAANELLISAANEYSKEEKWSKKTRFDVVSLITSLGTLGLLNTGPIYELDLKKDEKANVSAKSSVITSGGNLNIDAGNAKVIGSNISASKDIIAKTDVGSIEVLAAKEIEDKKSIEKKIEVGLANIFEVAESIAGFATKMQDTKLKITLAKATYDKIDTKSKDVTNKSSNITSDENITLDSIENINIEGSNISALEDLILKAEQDIKIKEAINTSNTDTKETHAKAEVNLTVQNEYVEAAKAYIEVEKATKQLNQTRKDYKKYKNDVKNLESRLSTIKKEFKNKVPGISRDDISDLSEILSDIKSDEKYYIVAIAAATVNLTSKTTLAIQQTAAATASAGTYGFSVGLGLDVSGSETKTDTNSTTAVASNIKANNITIETKTDRNNKTLISGSNVQANENLNINTNDLDIVSSINTSNSNSDSKDISGSVSMTVYGAVSGPQVSLGYGEQHNSQDSLTNTNSKVEANNINITTSNDTNIKGANVRAEDTLTLNVGNDLNIESQRDTYNSNSKGFNISAGFGFGANDSDVGSSRDKQNTLNQRVGVRKGNGEVSSAKGGFGANKGRVKVKETLLTSVTGNKVDLIVRNNTNLKGSLLASGNYDENGNLVDNENLRVSTKSLTFQNSSNTVYNTSNSFNIAANIGIGKTSKESTSDSKDGTKVNSSSVQYSNDKTYSKTKTLATLGKGEITITDEENSDDIDSLNRNTENTKKDIYDVSTGIKIDMTLDHRLLTEDGQKQIKEDYKQLNKNMNIIAGTLPDENSDNQIEATTGKVWNTLTKYLTLGLIPSNENRGGIIAEIPILTGENDSAHKKLLVVNKSSDKFNKNDYIKMEESIYYKTLSQKDKVKFNGKGLYISKNSIEVSSQTSTYQNAVNGMMNNIAEAIKNGLEQTGQMGTGKTVELTVGYNPSYGFIPDLLESLVDKSGMGTTGIAKQTGEFIKQVTTERGNNGSNFAMHSQGNALVYNGIKYIKENGGYKPVGYYFNVKDDKYNIPTFVSFGSPINGKDMNKIIGKGSLNYNYLGAYTKDGDSVGEILGGNKGNNKQASLEDKLNILNAYKLFTSDSPHSTYICEEYLNSGVKCGYK